MISIIIPARNEEKRLGATLQRLLNYLNESKFRKGYEVIVVNNGEDNTWKVARDAITRNQRIRLLDFRHALGKGGAVREGLRAAKGDAIVFDADASMPPKELPKLVDALKESDIAIGSRHLKESKILGLPAHRKIATNLFSLLTKWTGGLPFADTQCGFKAIRHAAVKKLLPSLTENGFAWDVELLYLARKKKLRVKEVPIEWHYCSGGTVTPGAAAKMIYDLLKLRARFS